MRAEAKVTLNLSSQKILETLMSALGPEIKHNPYARSRATVRKHGTTFILQIEAKDTTALRASLNSYLRWINAALNILNSLTPRQ